MFSRMIQFLLVLSATCASVSALDAYKMLCDDEYRQDGTLCKAMCSVIDHRCGGIEGCFSNTKCDAWCLEVETHKCGVHPERQIRRGHLCSTTARETSDTCHKLCEEIDDQCHGVAHCYEHESSHCAHKCRTAEHTGCGVFPMSGRI